MKFPADLQSVIKNKWFRWGAAGAGAIGLIVFLRARSSGAGSQPNQDAGAGGGTGYVGAPGLANTTGSDVAAALSNFGTGLQASLADYAATLNDAVGKIPTQDTPSPVPTPAPAPGPSAPAPASPSGQWVTVTKFTSGHPSWSSTISGIAGHFGVSNWQSVWSSAQNAALRASRGKPEAIRPGDRVWVG